MPNSELAGRRGKVSKAAATLQKCGKVQYGNRRAKADLEEGALGWRKREGRRNMRAVIIIPTYNERENIGPLIEALQDQFHAMRHEMSILVVDDNSPDRTAQAVASMRGAHGNLHLIEGSKSGLGSAYVRGIRHALDELDADAVFQMDADFSHQPKDVPRLIAALDAGADFVIGSRYVQGGSIPVEWGIARRLLSFGGNLITRQVAGLRQVHDCTAGFRGIRTSLLRQIDFGRLHVQGYAFLVALLFEARAKGARIEEIPVEFVERRSGRSKLGLYDVVEFGLNIGRLGCRRAWGARCGRLASFRFAPLRRLGH